MTVAGLVLVVLAAAIHGYVFVLESLTWTTPSTRRTFGVKSDAEAEATRLLAFNQGFYNLFLALVTVVGVVLVVTGPAAAGYALIVAGAGSMAGAGVVLAASNPRLLRAALIQLVPPGLGLVALGIGALL
ncbi:MAG: putative rane protein [Blastococcus sp.]|nr:putative rane protein [Blastococcus sp.]